MPGIACNKGFTLIELLLAMSISAFVAVIGYQGLHVAIEASRGVEAQTSTLADIQLALGILEEDISQIIARPVRNEQGGIDPVMSGGLSIDTLLLFTRGGWQNPRNVKRSELARINYSWNGNSLIRQRWMVLDRVSLEEGFEEIVLLDRVEDIRVEFYTPYGSTDNTEESGLAGNGRWVDWWSSERQGLDYTEPLPPAIRVTMFVSGFGEISRVFTVVSA